MAVLLSIVKRPLLGNVFCPHETVPTKRIQFTTTIQSLNSGKKSVQQKTFQSAFVLNHRIELFVS